VRAGADDFLRKPLMPVELQTRARSLIRLRQLRAELRRDRDAILSLQSQKEKLLQFVVHDLKNMLGSLLGSVDLMDPGGSPILARHRERLEETVLSMQSMVQSMLDLSVHEQAGLVPRPERIQVAPWLERLRQELEPAIRRGGQTLAFHVAADLELEADPQLLYRALFNLVQNASKFSPSGSEVRLTASVVDRRGDGALPSHHVGVHEEGRRASFASEGSPLVHAGCLRFEVADLGDGVPAPMKERIFDRFVRLDGSFRGHAGSGLGLAFCDLVTQLHQGRIWVEDNAPRGSRFLLELPQRFEPDGHD
jgi:signal transduction histidine kinase